TLASWVHGLRFDKIPPEQIEAAKDQVKSILGVIYAGSTMAPGVKLARAVRSFGDRAEATVIGRNRFTTSARQAAMANSFLAQLLEWEDWTFLAHSGASIVPVVLAVGLLTGAPAHAAVLAAQLAAQGLTGRRDLLESPLGYFYRVADIASPRRLARAVQDLGTDWRFARQYFNKRYPTDGFQLPAVHAML